MHRATFSVLQTSSIRHHQLLSPVRTTYSVKTDGQKTCSSMDILRITIGSSNKESSSSTTFSGVLDFFFPQIIWQFQLFSLLLHKVLLTSATILRDLVVSLQKKLKNMINNDRGQSLISKYVWVIETIYRRRKISFKELNERWLRDTDISRGVDIPKRTFDNWRYVIWDMFGISIVNENRGEYRYYIENEEDISKNGLRSWLYNTFCVSNALANSQNIKDRIILEYVPSGQDYLQPIIESMKENRVLNITYHSYWKDEENNFDVQPYCVKLFRQRWYLVARSTYSYYYEQGPRIYSLDRIKSLHTTEETFEMPKDWNAEEYFDGCFGIIADQRLEPQPVKLKVSASQANYIRDLKMHETQEEVERNEEYSIFTYYLRPSFDFQQELLWNGADMEVLEPLWLRTEIADKIKRMWDKYKE